MGLFDGSRKKMRKQRRDARRSKRQAKRLQKIYGDMSPDEIAAINDTAPDLGGAAGQLSDAGQPNTQDDGPLATAAAYNSQYGDGNDNIYADDSQTFADRDEHFGENGEGSSADPYLGAASDAISIIDRFRANWERNKPESWEGMEYAEAEHLFGLKKLFQPKKYKEDEQKEKEQKAHEQHKKIITVVLVVGVGLLLAKHFKLI